MRMRLLPCLVLGVLSGWSCCASDSSSASEEESVGLPPKVVVKVEEKGDLFIMRRLAGHFGSAGQPVGKMLIIDASQNLPSLDEIRSATYLRLKHVTVDSIEKLLPAMLNVRIIVFQGELEVGVLANLSQGNLQALTTLNLCNTQIGDEGAKGLAQGNFQALTTLHLQGNQIGDEGKAALRKAFPNAEITF